MRRITKAKPNSQNWYIKLLIVVIAAYSIQLSSNYIDKQVERAQRASIQGKQVTNAEAANLVHIQELPLFAAVNQPASRVNGNITNEIFSKRTIVKEEEKEATPPAQVAIEDKPEPREEIDFKRYFNEQFKVDGILHGGAVINGRFVSIREDVTPKIETPTGNYTARLVRTTHDRITLTVNHSVFSVAVR